jgi:hypothetical protein
MYHDVCSENKIGNEGATALARSLERNSTLNCLGIFRTLHKSRARSALVAIVHLYSDGYIGPEGAEALAQSLERNSTLTSLHISGTVYRNDVDPFCNDGCSLHPFRQ